MSINLGEKLKSLRKNKNISQEKLAQYLNVSFQAVSKWENSSTYPDIELLPELARFFGITVDELLGAEQIDEKNLYKEYETRAAEIYRNGDISKTLPIWREAYYKLPNNIEVKEMLMSIYFDIDKIKYQKEIVELGTEIYNSNSDSYFKGQAIWQIARTYAACGNNEMAEKWAFKAFPLMHSREMLFVQITDDVAEMLSEFRFANHWYLDNLFYMSAKIASCENIPGGTEYVQAVNKAITQMYELVFLNDDMGFEDFKRMCVKHRSIAEDEIALGKDENVVKHHLMRALECAERSISVKEHDLNCPLVMGWHVYDAPADDEQVARLLKKELSWDCFNEYRNKDWFIDIENRLDLLL
ncbi:MAG: helix-turn-helix transcriptional regulator [Ruminococcaceae bacterium]|nr:helix-turn-helix transcriptional regulator [Oscillospiraceae bacterium]